MLASFRALDLTDEKGFLCGRILGDLGADVIKIEKPGGDPARNIGPFYHDIPDPEKSLYWFVYNANKRGITLNVETSDGQEIFKRLVEAADFVIESFPPGHMEELGLGYSVLNELNPRIILTSVTPFGQSGPYKDYKAPDLVAMAMGGPMNLTGNADRPPVRIGFPQAYAHAGAQAAVGTLVAHYSRETTGQGQQVDVSMQESLVPLQFNNRFYWEFQGRIVRRASPYRMVGGITGQRVTWPCQDGHVSFILIGGERGARTNQQMVQWMDSKGMAPDFLKDIDWDSLDMFKATQEQTDQITGPISEFFLKHTVAELCEESLARRIQLYPVSTIKDLVEDPQLSAREFWTEVEHPELGTTITYPGAAVKLSETPCTIWRRAPLIGEHNQEIYGELGFSLEELTILKQGGII